MMVSHFSGSSWFHAPEFIFAYANLLFQRIDAGNVRLVFKEVANLFQTEAHPLERKDILHLL